MNTLIPGAPLRSLSPTSIEYQRAQGASRAAKPARAARFTLDAPEHSGTIPGAIGDILPPGVALTSNLAVIFTLNQYSLVRSLRRSASAFTCRSVPCFPSCAKIRLFEIDYHSPLLRRRWRRRVNHHEAAEHDSSKRRCCTARSKSLTSLMPVAESPGAVRIGHPERGHLVEYLAPNSVFNSLPRQRSCSHLRPDDRFVTIDRVLHHASLGEA